MSHSRGMAAVRETTERAFDLAFSVTCPEEAITARLYAPTSYDEDRDSQFKIEPLGGWSTQYGAGMEYVLRRALRDQAEDFRGISESNAGLSFERLGTMGRTQDQSARRSDDAAQSADSLLHVNRELRRKLDAKYTTRQLAVLSATMMLGLSAAIIADVLLDVVVIDPWLAVPGLVGSTGFLALALWRATRGVSVER